jgi:hypothetical protein
MHAMGPGRLAWLGDRGIALLGEMLEESGSRAASSIPLSRLGIVSLVFLGSGMSALRLAFAFLGRPLGLVRKVSN